MATVDELLKTGKYRHDRHGHMLSTLEHRVDCTPYSAFDDEQWRLNQDLYEKFWGPVPFLHGDDFDSRLSAWLATDYADKCIRGRTLKSLDVDCDDTTRRWIYGPADVEAIKAGYRFDESRAARVLSFVGSKLILYEGEYAGKLFRPLAWQVEMFSRLFGWCGFSKDWNREVRRFRKAAVFISKKNGKSPTGAAIGLYLTLDDGELGAKTFSAAKDGKQAGIIHMHARQFVKRHDYAMGKANWLGCTTQKHTGEIYHEATESYYRILSGDNISGQEGLNGNAIIDETHVVDARLAKVLEHMGASRSQAMQFEISTAGRDLMQYGYGQYEYGRLVENGDVIDHQFFFLGFGVFNEADADLDAEETHQRANPSWCVTIKPSEFHETLRRAKLRGKAAFDDFCMYRMNKWLSGGSPWLEPREWQACASPWDLEDKQGQPASIGIDLSRTRDMSAVVVAVGDGSECWIKPYLWITERYVTQWKERMPQWKDWEASGVVTVCDGETIDYRLIYETLEKIADVVSVRGIVFDPTYSAALVHWLQSSKLSHIELVKFEQNSTSYEGRIDEFEAAVNKGVIRHDGNRCLTWQAGHAETKTNQLGKRILIKPVSKDDPRKIDGMVASVMAHWHASQRVSVSGPLFVTV